MDIKLENTLLEVWQKVKEKHLFPNIPTPKFGETASAHISSVNKQIIVNPNFVIKFGKVVGIKNVLEALLDHEVAHFTFCPWDFFTHLNIFLGSYEVLKDKKLAEVASGYFMDICANTYCVSKFDTSIPILYRVTKRSEIDELMCGVYQRLWNVDLGVDENKKIRKLSRIPYLNPEKWVKSVKVFSLIIKKHLNKSESVHDFRRYSKGEIESGVKKLAIQLKNPKKFREILEIIRGDVTLPNDSVYVFYQELATRYGLEIIKMRTKGGEVLYPYSLKPWEVESPLRDLDYWNSYGKILPGITKIWKKRSGRIFGKDEEIPDCLIIIDSSGSMTNPAYQVSYAVVAALCAANAYLSHNSNVAVYNFAYSPCEELVEFTKDKSRIYKAIIKFFGGGTKINLDKIRKVLEGKDAVDIFMITDMRIYNLEEVVEFFSKIDNRVTIVYTKRSSELKEFRKKVKKNISFYQVKKEEDIPKIVLGQVEKYIGLKK